MPDGAIEKDVVDSDLDLEGSSAGDPGDVPSSDKEDVVPESGEEDGEPQGRRCGAAAKAKGKAKAKAKSAGAKQGNYVAGPGRKAKTKSAMRQCQACFKQRPAEFSSRTEQGDRMQEGPQQHLQQLRQAGASAVVPRTNL